MRSMGTRRCRWKSLLFVAALAVVLTAGCLAPAPVQPAAPEAEAVAVAPAVEPPAEPAPPFVPTTAVDRSEDPDMEQALAGDLVLKGPVQYGDLTVYPIATRAEATGHAGYQTLAQGLADGSVTVAESGGGSVPQLMVHNQGRRHVLLLAGDVVKGGKQDRVITADLVLLPGGEPVPVPVNCVEQGRWHPGTAGMQFAYGGKAEAGLRQVLQVERNQGATWSAVASLNSAKARNLGLVEVEGGAREDQTEDDFVESYHDDGPAGSSIGRLVGRHPQQQSAAAQQPYEPAVGQQLRQSQGRGQGRETASHALAPSTGTYMASLSAAEVQERVDACIAALLPALEQAGLVGMAVAIDGKLYSCEVFGHPNLFRAAREDAVRGAAMDALSVGRRGHAPPTQAEALAFVQDALQGGKVLRAANLAGGTRMEREGDQTRAFELRSEHGEILHVDAYVK